VGISRQPLRAWANNSNSIVRKPRLAFIREVFPHARRGREHFVLAIHEVDQLPYDINTRRTCSLNGELPSLRFATFCAARRSRTLHRDDVQCLQQREFARANFSLRRAKTFASRKLMS